MRPMMLYVSVVAVLAFGVPSGASAYTTITTGSGNDTIRLGTQTIGGVDQVVYCQTTSGSHTLNVIDSTHGVMQSAITMLTQGGSDNIYIVNGTEMGTVMTDCGAMSKLPYNGFTVTIDGGDGGDTMTGGDGDDLLYGDTIANCFGSDSGAGNDNLWLYLLDDIGHGCSGNDTVRGAPFNSYILDMYGDDGADCLYSYSWDGTTLFNTWDCGSDTGDTHPNGPYCTANPTQCSATCANTAASCPVR